MIKVNDIVHIKREILNNYIYTHGLPGKIAMWMDSYKTISDIVIVKEIHESHKLTSRFGTW